ncbi:MAG: 4-hydroxy-tetrahydrodipicolinate synthase [Bacteroidales bacterium]|nr:4-hydroxy-tetrahydrodipicolinate synthase [Bacteroidales bacterium]
MEKLTLKGCGTAMFTPFKDGKVDYETMAALTRRQVEAGMDFLVPLGTTGETPCLSSEEKLKVFRTVKENAGKVPVVVGVGTNSVDGTLANIDLLKEADAFLVVAPYYNKPPQRGLYEYFKAVAAHTPKPVILYNVPGRTGCNIEAATTLKLAQDVPNIIAVKEASGNIAQASAILEGKPEGFELLSGNDDDTLTLMRKGAAGVISVASNVCPELMVEFTHAALSADWDKADELDRRMHNLFKNLFVEPNPIPGKAAMALLGLMENSLRLPLVKALPETEELMKKTLQEL